MTPTAKKILTVQEHRRKAQVRAIISQEVEKVIAMVLPSFYRNFSSDMHIIIYAREFNKKTQTSGSE